MFSSARKKIMLLGSSMTERSFSLEHHGWGAALSNWYARSADVLNRGAGGYNSRWLKEYLPTILGGEKPDMAVLFIGNNDAIQEGEAQHVSLGEYKANVVQILEQLNSVNPSMVVLLISTTRVNEALKPLQRNMRRSRYTEVLRFIHRNRARPEVLDGATICQNIAFIDLWGGDHAADAATAAKQESRSITAEDLHDGAHLNSAGNKKVFAALRDAVNTLYPHLSPDVARPLHLNQHLKAKRSSSMDISASYDGKRLAVSGGQAGAAGARKRSAAQMAECDKAERRERSTEESEVSAVEGDEADEGREALRWTVPSWRSLS